MRKTAPMNAVGYTIGDGQDAKKGILVQNGGFSSTMPLSLKLCCVVLICTCAVASPVQVGAGGFSAGTVTADFLSFASGTLISNQLATPANFGLTFSSALGGIYANSDNFPVTGVPVSATSFRPSECPCVDVTLSFSSPVWRVGFNMFGGNSGMANFTTGTGVVSIAILQYPQRMFIGIEDLAGITSLSIHTPGTNGFIIDNVMMDGAVPEPGTLALVGAGLIGVGWIRRRNRT